MDWWLESHPSKWWVIGDGGSDCSTNMISYVYIYNIYIYNILHSYHMTIKIWVVHENYDFTSTIPCRPRHPLAPSIWHPPHRASVDLSVLPQPLTARIAGGLREQIAREARELGGTQRLQVTCWENAAFHRWKSWKYVKIWENGGFHQWKLGFHPWKWWISSMKSRISPVKTVENWSPWLQNSWSTWRMITGQI